MHLIRSNHRVGAWAAVLALAIQFVASFGHIHREDIFGPSVTAAVSSQAQSADTGPANDDDHGAPGHDVCDICATLSLASSSVLPTVPLPVPPVEYVQAHFVHVLSAQLFYVLHSGFHARAPPDPV